MASKKRFIASLFVVAIVLAIPITITMVNSQQDIRQQAAGWNCTQLIQYYNQYLSNCTGQNAQVCQIIQTQLAQLNCNATPSATLTPIVTGSLPTATPTAGLTSTPTATLTTSPSPTAGPLTNVQRIFDFNDDGKINEVDLNILYVGFSKRDGD